MRKIRFLSFCLILLFAGSSQILFAQSKKEKAEKKAAAVKEIVESRHFTITVNRALPMSGPSINLTTPYSVRISGDSIYSSLPYYGEAYSIPYGGGDGLMFSRTVSNYKCTFNKKSNARVNFKTVNGEESFLYQLNIYSNGSASVAVIPMNRQTISYQGELEMTYK